MDLQEPPSSSRAPAFLSPVGSDYESAPTETFYQSKKVAIDAFERNYFRNLVWRCQGNVSEMARQSGMKRHHVRTYLRRHGIDRRDPWLKAPELGSSLDAAAAPR